MTAAEVIRYLEAAEIRQKREFNQDAWMMYHSAALVRAKKLPKLERFMQKAEKKPQSVEEQIAIAKRFHHIVNKWQERHGI